MPHPRSGEILDSILSNNPLFLRNWEAEIAGVKVEKCLPEQDPLGYQAVFYFEKESQRAAKNKSFIVGASFLAQRKANIRKSGYKAPMTDKAINNIEKKIGEALPMIDLEALGRLA